MGLSFRTMSTSDNNSEMSDSRSHASSSEESESSSDALMPGPYSFEPSETDSDGSLDSSTSFDEDDPTRLTDLSWVCYIIEGYALLIKLAIYNRCECGHCILMATSAKCVCCKEVTQIMAKIKEANESIISCITERPGFEAVCLNVWVLQAAYFQYRQEDGATSSPPSFHE